MSTLSDPAINRRARGSPGILERELASTALSVLKLMRPKPPLDCVRMEWYCACGVQMYADYPRSRDLAEFQETLGDTRERPPSFAHIVGEDRSKLLRVATNWIPVLPFVALPPMVVVLSFAMTSPRPQLENMVSVTFAVLTLAILVVSAIFAGELPALFQCSRSLCADRFPTATNPPTPSNGHSAFALRSSAQQTNFPSLPPLPPMFDFGSPLYNLQSVAGRLTEDADVLDTPTYLELCVSRGVDSIHWGEIKLRDAHNLPVDSDASMFGT
jgi:hypothetical protein